MLKQRVLTALVLLAILLPALAYPDTRAFMAFITVAIVAGAWEWGRMCGLRQAGALAFAGVLALVLGMVAWTGWVLAVPPLVWWLAGGAWVLGTAWLLARGVPAWGALPVPLRLIAAALALTAAWAAAIALRVQGINYLLSVLVLVFAADIGAYAAGRLLGGRFFRRKLAPSISPGKTWEGVLGGATLVVVVALLWMGADRHYAVDSASLYSRLAALGPGVMGLSLCFLTAMSVVGDLVESLIKRSAGVKDSSQLLPGHGGVLDRLDAILPTVTLAMMLGTL